MAEYRNILVRATNWIGDAVMSLPALRALRARYPGARMTILAMPWVADLYGRESFCDELIPWTAARGFRDLGAKWRLARSLRGPGFDLAVILPNSFDSALPAWISRIPVRVGFDRDARGWMLTHAVPRIQPGDTPPHQSFHYLELLRRAHLIERIPENAEIRLEGVRVEKRNVIGVSPGAAFGGAKRWLPERFAEAAVAVAAPTQASIAIFGAKDEVGVCGEVEQAIAGRAAVQNHAGRTSLKQFIEEAAACRAFLTNDSGSMHVVSALGVPVVAVFGSTDPVATGPTGANARIVQEPVECSPCFHRECPLNGEANLRCLRLVTAERVAQRAFELLK